MPYLKIYLHIVWSTHNREPYLKKEIRQQVYDHIKENAILKDINIIEVDGSFDHIHLLISMNAQQNIATIVNLVKGESSHWINLQKLSKNHFSWQDDYFAVSVSYSQLDKVINYIRNQEEHHKKKTFQQEYDEFISIYKFEGEKG